MFTKGQWLFGVLFFIAFVLVLIYAYNKDRLLHKKHYKGTFWVLVGFIAFITIIALIKYIFV